MKKTKIGLKKEALLVVNNLFDQAKIIFNKNPDLSNRYINLARKAAMRFNLRIPKNLKRKFCRHCYSYIVPGKNCRVRIHKSRIIYYCFNCKNYMRFAKNKINKK